MYASKLVYMFELENPIGVPDYLIWAYASLGFALEMDNMIT